MATNTPKLNLVKPEVTDPVDIDVLNGNMDILDDALAPTSITTPAAGQKLVFDGTNWVNLDGYVYVDTVYFTSSGTFTKATYPWLRAIRVRCQGGGGGGAGAAATGAGQVAAAAGGGGGHYAESFITDIAGLSASVTVTRGGGGAGGVGNIGSSGGSSSFGSLVVAGGGSLGQVRSPTTTVPSGIGGSDNQLSATGDITITGSSASLSLVSQATTVLGAGGGNGGSSHLGGGGTGRARTFFNPVGGLYGGGGGGALNDQNRAANTGGAGGNGIVIVELYA